MSGPTRRARAISAAAAIGLLGFAGACAGSPTLAAERAARATRGRGDVVIAVVWPWAARTEIRYWEGLEMAVGEANAAGGVNGRKLRLVRWDDGESVDQARLVAQRLAADPDIVAVIGHLQSYTTVPAAAVYDEAGLVQIAPTATDPELTAHGYGRLFRATFTDDAIGRQVADLAARSGYRRVAIYYIRNTYGRDLANAFERRATALGLLIVARQSYDPSGRVTEEAFEPTLREWKTLELDAIFVAGEVPSGALLIAAARRQGIRVPILGGDAMSSPALIKVAGAAAEGTVVATIFHPDEPRPEVARFTAAFEQKYGLPPDAGSAIGYDAVGLLADAMRRAGSSAPEAVARSLHASAGWHGVTGTFAFDANGDLVDRGLVTVAVRDGRFTFVAQPSAPVAGAK